MLIVGYAAVAVVIGDAALALALLGRLAFVAGLVAPYAKAYNCARLNTEQL